MKAQLVLGEIELQSGKQESGHRHLEELVHAAEAKGFRLDRTPGSQGFGNTKSANNSCKPTDKLAAFGCSYWGIHYVHAA